MNKPKGFFTYFHHINVISRLSDDQAGRLYKALLQYGYTGEVTDFGDDPACDIAYTLLRGEVDYNFERYEEICEHRRAAGKRSAEARRKQNDLEDEISEFSTIRNKC